MFCVGESARLGTDRLPCVIQYLHTTYQQLNKDTADINSISNSVCLIMHAGKPVAMLASNLNFHVFTSCNLDYLKRYRQGIISQE